MILEWYVPSLGKLSKGSLKSFSVGFSSLTDPCLRKTTPEHMLIITWVTAGSRKRLWQLRLGGSNRNWEKWAEWMEVRSDNLRERGIMTSKLLAWSGGWIMLTFTEMRNIEKLGNFYGGVGWGLPFYNNAFCPFWGWLWDSLKHDFEWRTFI